MSFINLIQSVTWPATSREVLNIDINNTSICDHIFWEGSCLLRVSTSTVSTLSAIKKLLLEGSKPILTFVYKYCNCVFKLYFLVSARRGNGRKLKIVKIIDKWTNIDQIFYVKFIATCYKPSYNIVCSSQCCCQNCGALQISQQPQHICWPHYLPDHITRRTDTAQPPLNFTYYLDENNIPLPSS